MKVYCFTLEGGYRGGCIIVAANSPFEAYGLICDNDKMAAEYFTPSRCTEIENLSYGGSEPTLLVSNYYIE